MNSMRIFIVGLLAFILASCAGVSAPPGIDEFPDQEISFRVAGNNDAVLRDLQDYLANRGLPSSVTLRTPKIFIITTYIEEPGLEQDRRTRRTAFRFGLSSASGSLEPACTSVSTVSLTKSRGKREELWSVQDQDVTYVSSAWPDIRELFKGKACK
jgi:hypothetical protein